MTPAGLAEPQLVAPRSLVELASLCATGGISIEDLEAELASFADAFDEMSPSEAELYGELALDVAEYAAGHVDEETIRHELIGSNALATLRLSMPAEARPVRWMTISYGMSSLTRDIA